jgi:hypothetical protein
MTQTFGSAVPGQHIDTDHPPAARYLVVLPSGGPMIARLFLENRQQVAEFDASTEEVVGMSKGLVPQQGALAAEWDAALAGHSRDERAQAEIFVLDV